MGLDAGALGSARSLSALGTFLALRGTPATKMLLVPVGRPLVSPEVGPPQAQLADDLATRHD